MRAAATLFVSTFRTGRTPAASSTAAGAAGRVSAAGALLVVVFFATAEAAALGVASLAAAAGLVFTAVAGFVALATGFVVLATGAFAAVALPSGAEVLRGAGVDFVAAFVGLAVDLATVFGAAFAALEGFEVPVATARVFVTFAPALDLACAVALFKGARAARFRDAVLLFRAAVVAADFETDEFALAVVEDFVDLAEVREAAFAARVLVEAVAALRDVVREAAGRAARVFEAPALTETVFAALFLTELVAALEAVFALPAGALDATAGKARAFEMVAFEVALAVLVALAAVDLGGMLGTLPC